MRLHELYPFPEERKEKKRLGRGRGSGTGCTSGKGNKGQNSRSGTGGKVGFEGGQMPILRRLPKFGFYNPARVEYAAVNLQRLASEFPGATEITLDHMYDRGIARPGTPVKILGQGEIGGAVTVEAHRFSASAKEKITKAGGSAKELEG